MLINWTTTTFHFLFARYVYMYRKAKSILTLASCVINGYKLNYPLLTKIVEMLSLKAAAGHHLHMNSGVSLSYLDARS